jgi:hypothetical protein
MLDLGHSHPDFVYDNDLKQAKLTLFLMPLAAIICCVMIVAAVFTM